MAGKTEGEKAAVRLHATPVWFAPPLSELVGTPLGASLAGACRPLARHRAEGLAATGAVAGAAETASDVK